ncbi:MAG: hypothetical protein FJY10_01995 [Bacteroidetes bacterium]|nr:hypothetical protein [Bacteroidota bacterium]
MLQWEINQEEFSRQMELVRLLNERLTIEGVNIDSLLGKNGLHLIHPDFYQNFNFIYARDSFALNDYGFPTALPEEDDTFISTYKILPGIRPFRFIPAVFQWKPSIPVTRPLSFRRISC